MPAFPTVGQPQQVKGASGQAEQQFVQPIPPVPGRDWTASHVVQGFLAASASFAGAPAAARFLAPPLRRTFKPANTVTVLSGPLRPLARRIGSRTIEGESTVVKTISLTGQQLAIISDVGQYVDNPAPRTYVFQLARYHGQWLIIHLPNESGVLLTQSNFVQVYQPRNLYVFSPLAGGQGLVPEPLFAPQQDTYSDLAQDLIKALLDTSQEKAWLSPATNTAFTPGMHLKKVTIVGSDAVVDLGGAVDGLGADQLSQMAAQLVATLTSTSYGQAPISKSVTLELNGQVPPEISKQSLDPQRRPGPGAGDPGVHHPAVLPQRRRSCQRAAVRAQPDGPGPGWPGPDSAVDDRCIADQAHAAGRDAGQRAGLRRLLRVAVGQRGAEPRHDRPPSLQGRSAGTRSVISGPYPGTRCTCCDRARGSRCRSACRRSPATARAPTGC